MQLITSYGAVMLTGGMVQTMRQSLSVRHLTLLQGQQGLAIDSAAYRKSIAKQIRVPSHIFSPSSVGAPETGRSLAGRRLVATACHSENIR